MASLLLVQILWKDEKYFEKPVWIYRLQFDIIYVIDPWKNGIDPPADVMLNTGTKLIKKNIFTKLIKIAEKQWNVKIR